MYTAETMTFAQALTVSGLGLATVFTCLASLIVAIMIFTKIFAVGSGKAAPKAAAAAPAAKAAAPAAPALDEETYAALMTVVSEEAGLSLEQFKIDSIREL